MSPRQQLEPGGACPPIAWDIFAVDVVDDRFAGRQVTISALGRRGPGYTAWALQPATNSNNASPPAPNRIITRI